MQVGGRKLRQAANPVVGVLDGLEQGGEGLFHGEIGKKKERCLRLNLFNRVEKQKEGYDTTNRMNKLLTMSLSKNHKPV